MPNAIDHDVSIRHGSTCARQHPPRTRRHDAQHRFRAAAGGTVRPPAAPAIRCLAAGLAAALLTIVAPPGLAQPAGGGLDLRQAIDIEANEALFDDRSGVGEYRGDVVVRQGDLTLFGDRLRLYSENRRLTRALLEGQLARVVDANPAAPREAEAREIDYSLTRDEITLRGDARVQTPNEDARGDEIVYSMRDDTLRATAASGNRVRVTIVPRGED